MPQLEQQQVQFHSMDQEGVGTMGQGGADAAVRAALAHPMLQ
jgi:hypothetical protein